ncbi:MAG: branched-chain amino acid ABC transporter permease [Actinomycetia bacterium]|nr:branched-chain amino acid ABC transporter permease [Actinomycetes bacterium]
MSLLGMAVGFGLVTASVLALAAVGLSLQFGVTNYVNFAYGEFLTLGAYFAWIAEVSWHLNFWVALVVGALLTGFVAVVANRLILRPFVRRRSPLLFLLIVTLGLSLILSNLTLAIFGADFRRYNLGASPSVHVGPMLFTVHQLIVIGIAVVAMVGLHLLLSRTKLGKAMRALSDDPELARISGIDSERIIGWTWMLSGFLAGLAGIVLAINITTFQPSFGGDFLFVIFAAVILGGIGQPYGAMLGALVIGLATEISAVFIDPAYKNDVAFLILVVMLLLRPQGLIASRGRA